MRTHLLSLSLLLLLFNLSLAYQLCNPQDKKVLLRIKAQYGNPPSLATWDSKNDCCIDWIDIRCNNNCRVIRLGISNANDIHGSLPSFLDQLPFLSSIYLYNISHLSGSIPLSIAKLTSLTQLAIYHTNLTGPIPNFLGLLTSLTSIELISNRFTGPIPKDLASLKQLNYLGLSSNKLSGPIPDFLGRELKKLNTINLEYNDLSGSIPASLGSLSYLTGINFSGNGLSGLIPKSLVHPPLFSIDLSNNKLYGDASFLFERNNTDMTFLYLNNNSLKFNFSNVNLGSSIRGFNIKHNMIYGSLPRRFGQMRPDSIDVSYNQLCGPIPNGRRFKLANPDIFAHNKCLCGGPLPACK